MTPRPRCRRGFTLIELLVAVSIIALLIGILLPTLAMARNRARSASCLANLHNFAQVMTLYHNDYDDVFPVARHMPPPMLTGDTDPPLTVALRDYLPLNADRTNNVYHCSGDDELFPLCGSSYNYLMFLFAGQKLRDTWLTTLLRVPPDKIGVMSDNDGGTFDLEPPPNGPGGQLTVGFFHADRNFLFADGHAAIMQTGDTP